ncbi:MAG: hypothetical protein HQL40_04860 [Alphaproteobacteria bacterium]|nr:hypothetical protein [Alphaproteobacteria bacterium]
MSELGDLLGDFDKLRGASRELSWPRMTLVRLEVSAKEGSCAALLEELVRAAPRQGWITTTGAVLVFVDGAMPDLASAAPVLEGEMAVDQKTFLRFRRLDGDNAVLVRLEEVAAGGEAYLADDVSFFTDHPDQPGRIAYRRYWAVSPDGDTRPAHWAFVGFAREGREQ